MYRRTAHRGVAALALVLMLVLIGAQPAAAADRTVLDRFASFWGAVIYTVPGAHAALNTLTGWFNKATTDPQPTAERGFGIDPNGNELLSQPEPPAPPAPGN
jgi:ABC-type transport system substrate-binding protein